MRDHGPPSWRTSTECVAVAFVDDCVLVRHSKDPAGPVLAFTLPEWRAFLIGATNGEFDTRT